MNIRFNFFLDLRSIVNYEMKRREILPWDISTSQDMNETEKFQQCMKLVIINILKDKGFHQLEGNWLEEYEVDFNTDAGTFFTKCIKAGQVIFEQTPFNIGLGYNGVPEEASQCLTKIALSVFSERIGRLFRGSSKVLWTNETKITG